ncbi:MAG TPA: LacI family DNA-binding transcriptional regulator [Rhodothermales bacterium]|nr:LacI family DNA-binding transcriptional regulator [Rhodothermales bacterium]
MAVPSSPPLNAPPGPRVRLVDIAERLNLTKVSVSKALRDHPDISLETRKLVKRTAAAMGYSPNLLARSLSSRQSFTLGVVVPKIAHTFFSAVIDAIQARATAAGYGIVLTVSNERADLERQHIERLLAMRVDGLLVSVSQEAPELAAYERVRSMGVPLVFFDRKIEGLPFSSVTVDDRGGAYAGTARLIGEGHRRIAHLAGAQETEIGRARREGFEAALADHGLSVRPDWIVPGGFDEAHGYRGFQAIHATGELPDALFAASFPVALGARAAMRDLDPALLDRIRVLAFGDGGLNEVYAFPHVCVRQPTRAMGEHAVALLLQTIEAEEPEPPRAVVLSTDLVSTEDSRAAYAVAMA